MALLAMPTMLAIAMPAPGGLSSPTGVTYVCWQAYYAMLIISILLVARHAVGSAASATPDAVRSLTPTGWLHYFAWSERSGSLRHQWGSAVGGAGCSTLAIAALAHTSARKVLYLGPSSYVMVCMAGALAGCALYWLVRGVMLGRSLSGPENFELLWTMPARTPAVEQLSRIFRLGFYVASFAATLYSYPVLWLATRMPQSNDLIIIVKFGFLGAAAIGTLSIGVLPQLWVSKTVAVARRESIYRAAAAAADESLTPTEFNSMASLLKSIADTPASTINDRTVVGIIFGFVAAVGPGVVQLMFRHG